MNTNIYTTPSVTAVLVPDAGRIAFLPRHFGRRMILVEQEIFTQMREICESYSGGYFNFYDLSNGGCFIALATSEPLNIRVLLNGYAGTMSAEGAGITATLSALSNLSFQFPDVERLAECFYQLRAFALDHAEAGAIFAAID